MEGLTLPSGSRATTAFHPASANGFIFWSGLGPSGQRRSPSPSFCLSSPPIPQDGGPGRLVFSLVAWVAFPGKGDLVFPHLPLAPPLSGQQ